MNAERSICKLEDLSRLVGEPVFSIQGEVLTFNPHYFDNPNFLFHTRIDEGIPSDDFEFAYQLRRFVQKTCSYCKLCQPRFIDQGRSKYLIERRDYGLDNFAPGFEISLYNQEGKPNAVVCVIDDEESIVSSIANFLKENGIKAYAFLIYTNRITASPFETTALAQQIVDNHPDVIFCDKGLGSSYSGIEVIRKVREFSEDRIKTVMMTGEPDTRETHNVAHHLLLKPVSRNTLLGSVFSESAPQT